MSGHYILNPDHTVTEIVVWRDGVMDQDALMRWAKWMEDFEKRRVMFTEFEDGSQLSTVFLGIDHAFFDGPPMLFESMLFSSRTRPVTFNGRTRNIHDELDMDRYSTWDEAVAGHKSIEKHREQIIKGMAFMEDNAALMAAMKEAIKKARTE